MSSIAQVIPQDIIHEIFVQVAGANRLETFRALYPGEFPWYLGHICSWWRTTLLSMITRKLFVAINTETAERITDQVTHFLELNRGRQFDLVVLYYCRTLEGCIWTDAMSHIFGLLVAESAHWRHVHLRACHPCAILRRYRLKDHLPSLQSLRIEDIRCHRVASFHGGCRRDSFANTPLTHLELSLADWDWKFDWSNLTYLHLGGLRRNDNHSESIFLSLQQAINLNTLVTDTVFTNLTRNERITLPCLESWRAYDCHWLRYIKAPALQNLYMDSVCDDGIDVVISFLRESGCKLAYLTWDGTKEPSSFSKILRHAPELVHVKVLGDSDIIAASIESLSVPIPADLVFGSDLPAPRLRSLQVEFRIQGWHQGRNINIDGLSKFLLFRNRQTASNGGRPVDRVKWLIVGNDMIQDERLRRLCEAFRVELHSPADARALPIPSIFDSISKIF
jgi:hypothetical protein